MVVVSTCVWRTESIPRGRRGLPSGRLHLGPSAWLPGPPGKLLDWGREVGETALQAEVGQGGERAEKKAKSASSRLLCCSEGPAVAVSSRASTNSGTKTTLNPGVGNSTDTTTHTREQSLM